jgi:hypothetical protein
MNFLSRFVTRSFVSVSSSFRAAKCMGSGARLRSKPQSLQLTGNCAIKSGGASGTYSSHISQGQALAQYAYFPRGVMPPITHSMEFTSEQWQIIDIVSTWHGKIYRVKHPQREQVYELSEHSFLIPERAKMAYLAKSIKYDEYYTDTDAAVSRVMKEIYLDFGLALDSVDPKFNEDPKKMLLIMDGLELRATKELMETFKVNPKKIWVPNPFMVEETKCPVVMLNEFVGHTLKDEADFQEQYRVPWYGIFLSYSTPFSGNTYVYTHPKQDIETIFAGGVLSRPGVLAINIAVVDPSDVAFITCYVEQCATKYGRDHIALYNTVEYKCPVKNQQMVYLCYTLD